MFTYEDKNFPSYHFEFEYIFFKFCISHTSNSKGLKFHQKKHTGRPSCTIGLTTPTSYTSDHAANQRQLGGALSNQTFVIQTSLGMNQ